MKFRKGDKVHFTWVVDSKDYTGTVGQIDNGGFLIKCEDGRQREYLYTDSKRGGIIRKVGEQLVFSFMLN